MNETSENRGTLKKIVRLLAVVAVLAAGYVGMQLAPSTHATVGGAAQHTQRADTCGSSATHC